MALTELTPETAVLQLPPSANGAARLSPPKKYLTLAPLHFLT